MNLETEEVDLKNVLKNFLQTQKFTQEEMISNP